jgi:hypothetical protein
MADKFNLFQKLVVLPDGYDFDDDTSDQKRKGIVRLKKDKEKYKKENKRKEVDDERGAF